MVLVFVAISPNACKTSHVSKFDQKACLALAARRGCIEVLMCFGCHGLSRDNLGITPLMYDAGAGELETVK
jgi:hypothetical protein